MVATLQFPVFCRFCDHRTEGLEDKRFEAHAPVGTRMYGAIESYAACALLPNRPPDNECPEYEEECPLYEREEVQ